MPVEEREFEAFRQEFRSFKDEVIDRLARIETRLDQREECAADPPKRNSAAIATAIAALVEVIRVLTSAILAFFGVRMFGGGG